jgi:hypothetical protein
MSYMLLAISLLLGLIGTFTETFDTPGETKEKKLTQWGVMVGGLLLLSTVLTATSQYRSGIAERKRAAEMAEILSQQRLIAITSVSTKYDLRSAYIGISYPIRKRTAANLRRYEREFDRAKLFLGLGVNFRRYRLNIAPNDLRSFSYYDRNVSVPNDSTEKADGLKHSLDQLPEEVSHLYTFNTYRTVDELLFDFRSGRKIGELMFWKDVGWCTNRDLKRVIATLSRRGHFHIRIYLKRDSADLYLAYVEIPIRIGATNTNKDECFFELIATEPVMNSVSFAPI